MYVSNLYGLAEDIITPAPGVPSGSPVTGQETRRPIELSAEDCPCDCDEQLVEETWFLSDKPSAGAIPIPIKEKTIECDTPPNTEGEYDPECEDIVAALRAMGYTTMEGLAACQTMRGLGNTGADTGGSVQTGGQTSGQAGGQTPPPVNSGNFLTETHAGIPMWMILALGGTAAYMLFAKKKKG